MNSVGSQQVLKTLKSILYEKREKINQQKIPLVFLHEIILDDLRTLREPDTRLFRIIYMFDVFTKFRV